MPSRSSFPATDSPVRPLQEAATESRAAVYGAEITEFVRDENEVLSSAAPSEAMQMPPAAAGRLAEQASAGGSRFIADNGDEGVAIDSRPLRHEAAEIGVSNVREAQAELPAGSHTPGNQPFSLTVPAKEGYLKSGNAPDSSENAAELLETQLPPMPQTSYPMSAASAGSEPRPSGRPSEAGDTTERQDRKNRDSSLPAADKIQNFMRHGAATGATAPEYETMPPLDRDLVHAGHPDPADTSDGELPGAPSVNRVDSRRVAVSAKRPTNSPSGTIMSPAGAKERPRTDSATSMGETAHTVPAENEMAVRPDAAVNASRPPSRASAPMPDTPVASRRTAWAHSNPAVFSGEKEPSVVVRIGRIDVRAITPPAATPVREARRGPTLSLDEYLRQRGRTR